MTQDRTINKYHNKKESQEKNIKKSLTSYYCKLHNFDLRGSLHLVNVNGKYFRAQINSRRRIKAREKSVELGLPVRTFDDETHLTSRELLQVIKNKEAKEFKNGISAQLKGRSTYVLGRFNPHKAKKIFPNLAQKEAEKYFVELMLDKFYSLKTSQAPDVLSIREDTIKRVLEKFQDHPEIKAITVYVKNLWITYDEHLYSTKGMKEKVDRHIDFIIQNTSQEREEKLLAAGATPEEVYQILRTVQGYNLYHIGILAKRGGPSLEIHIRKELQRRLKLLFNRFRDRMARMGVATEKDFFLIARRHVSFLFNEKYVHNRRRVIREVRRMFSYTRENPFQVLEDYYRLCEEWQPVEPPG